jgi:hypothetical protein
MDTHIHNLNIKEEHEQSIYIIVPQDREPVKRGSCLESEHDPSRRSDGVMVEAGITGTKRAVSKKQSELWRREPWL